jgi:hypothetical protein
MNRNRILYVAVVLFVSAISFLAGMHYSIASTAQAQGRRPFQMYKLIKLDAATTPPVMADEMNDYAQMGYRFRDSHDGLVILEYAGK